MLTKATLLEGKVTCKFKDDKEYPAAIIGVHEALDLSLLKIDAKDLKPIAWRDSKDVMPGELGGDGGDGGGAGGRGGGQRADEEVSQRRSAAQESQRPERLSGSGS